MKASVPYVADARLGGMTALSKVTHLVEPAASRAAPRAVSPT